MNKLTGKLFLQASLDVEGCKALRNYLIILKEEERTSEIMSICNYVIHRQSYLNLWLFGKIADLLPEPVRSQQILLILIECLDNFQNNEEIDALIMLLYLPNKVGVLKKVIRSFRDKDPMVEPADFYQRLKRSIPKVILRRLLKESLTSGDISGADRYAEALGQEITQGEYEAMLAVLSENTGSSATSDMIVVAGRIDNIRIKYEWLRKALGRAITSLDNENITKVLKIQNRMFLNAVERDLYIARIIDDGRLSKIDTVETLCGRCLSDDEVELLFNKPFYGNYLVGLMASLKIVVKLMCDWDDMDYYLDLIKNKSILSSNLGLYVQLSELTEEAVSVYDLQDMLNYASKEEGSYNKIVSILNVWHDKFPDTPLDISQSVCCRKSKGYLYHPQLTPNQTVISMSLYTNGIKNNLKHKALHLSPHPSY